MFRNRRDSDNSDDEPERTRAMCASMHSEDNDSCEPKAKRSNNVWGDVVLEQSLETRSANVVLDKGSKLQQVRRGAESYEVPADLIKEDAATFVVENPIVTVTPASDDPFGESVDIGAVEEFGMGASRSFQSRGRGGVRGRGRPFQRQEGGRDPRPGKGQDDEMTGEGTGGGSRGSKSGWMRGRGRGQYWQNRGRGAGPQGQKRNWTGKVNDVSTLLKKEYSLESLMATEFAADIPLKQLGEEMAAAMGENDPTTVVSIVEAIGTEKAMTLFDETREVESGGGLKTLDGSRRRTPGGVFISLFKSDVNITPEVKDSIFDFYKKENRKVQRAKRRGNFGDTLKQAAELLKKESEKDAGLKPLPDVIDVIKPSEGNDKVDSGETSARIDDEAQELDMTEMES